jgi:hypothetical protein
MLAIILVANQIVVMVILVGFHLDKNIVQQGMHWIIQAE